MLSCCHPITGGRVGEIVRQEAKWCRRKDQNSVPVAHDQDKFEKFRDTYSDFIDVADAADRFGGHWESLKQAAGESLLAKRNIPLIFRALFKSFNHDLLKAFFSKLVWSVLVIFSIWFFVFEILDFIRKKEKGTGTAQDEKYEFFLFGFFFVSMLLLSIGIQQMGIYSSILGSKVKAALTTAIYKKMMIREAYGSKADVVSLIAKDVEKLAEACLSLQYLWSGIFETLSIFAVTVTLLGAAILPGLGMMCLYLPLQYWLELLVDYKKKDLTELSDKRIWLIEEVIRGIKLIKMYGWEASFLKNLSDVRKEEGNSLNGINLVKATILGLIFSLPPLMCMVIFGTKEVMGEIESVVAFTTLSFFNTLRVPFSKLPKSLRDVIDAFSCMERIEHFLLEPELSEASKMETTVSSHVRGIVFRDVSVSYGRGANTILSNINLDIPRGALMMVAGPVASGKSTLIKSILGHLTIVEGSCHVSPSKAYVPQTPWTALGTVKDNILFGKAFDEALYRQVLHACALEPDLKIMEKGDQTWIRERGGNLSGGQKQRIALARAAYSCADLYILDSPLSTVDMHTCQHIFKYCIQELMIRNGGTVVLATHQAELFSMSDHLVVLERGHVAYNDKYIYNAIKHLFPNFCGEAELVDTAQLEKPIPEHQPKPYKALMEGMNESNSALVPVATKSPALPPADDTNLKTTPHANTANANIESIYVWYIKKLGVAMFMVATLVFMMSQIFRVSSDAWISNWTTRKFAPRRTKAAFYAGIYALLVFSFVCMAFFRAFFYFCVGRVGADKIHDSSVGATLKAPMHFFHVTPVGKLLSYFSKDVDTIDDILVDNMLMFQIFFWILILALGVVVYNLPMFLAIIGGLSVVYVYIVRVYIRTSGPLKKAAGQSVSQVVAQTSETLSGLSVVRAYQMQERFLSENLKFQARSTVVNFSLANLSLWLAFRVDIIGSLLVLACCLLAVLDADMDASVGGMIVSNSFQILLFFSIMSRTMVEVHDNMNAVEEARRMSDLEAEHEPMEVVDVPTKWPTKGVIQFNGVVMPYWPNTPPVLKGISFVIHEGEKIGVVGRTGAGKSSLIVALYRLAEISSGTIQVDSIDCSRVNLNKLRSSMAIIPQETLMFAGTIRSNLDPFQEHNDGEIVDVLHKCLLGPMLDANEDGLNAKVDFLGSNFSLGTQQLMCLARAMLNPSRILLLDEATAALDSDTNAAVQQVLRAHFFDRTIFTIAHRLDTIIDSDRVLVMSAGVVAEFDAPDVLLADPDSIFYELCIKAGRSQFEVLAAKARANALSKVDDLRYEERIEQDCSTTASALK